MTTEIIEKIKAIHDFLQGASEATGNHAFETARSSLMDIITLIHNPKKELLGQPIEYLCLPIKIHNALIAEGVSTISDLIDLTEHYLVNRVCNLGPLSVSKIKSSLANHGLALKK